MPHKYKILLIIVVAIFLWVFFLDKKLPLKKTNVVSLQNSSKSQIIANQAPSVVNKNSNITEPNQLINPLSQQSTNDFPDRSYMELYKKLLVAEDCYLIFSTDDKMDPKIDRKSIEQSAYHLKKYQENIKFNSNYRQQEATTKQLEYFNEYINECNVLKDEVINYFDDDGLLRPLYLIDKNIRKKMDETKPKTDVEIDLKRTLKLSHDLKKNSETLLRLNNGKYTISEEEVHKLESLIRGLIRKLNESKFYGEEAKNSDEYLKIQEKLNRAKEAIDSVRVLDMKKITITKKSVIKLLHELQLNLTTEYPTVFIESFKALNFGPTYSLPSVYKISKLHKTDSDLKIITLQIYDDLPIKNKKYFNTLLSPALDLYLCYLGDDCHSINNRTKKRLCYIPRILFEYDHAGIFYEACDVSLEDFYLLDYLTENQVEDMNVLFEYLVDNYAK